MQAEQTVAQALGMGEIGEKAIWNERLPSKQIVKSRVTATNLRYAYTGYRILVMKEKPKGTERSTAHDALPHDIVVAIAGGVGTAAAKAAIQGAKKIIAKTKA